MTFYLGLFILSIFRFLTANEKKKRWSIRLLEKNLSWCKRGVRSLYKAEKFDMLSSFSRWSFEKVSNQICLESSSFCSSLWRFSPVSNVFDIELRVKIFANFLKVTIFFFLLNVLHTCSYIRSTLIDKSTELDVFGCNDQWIYRIISTS